MLSVLISWFKPNPINPEQGSRSTNQSDVSETIPIVPHSCRHCEKVLLPAPDVDLVADEDSLSGPSKLMWDLQLLMKRDSLQVEENPRLLNVEPQHLEDFVMEGCLFYEYISKGLKRLHDEEKRRNERSPPPPNLERTFISAEDNQNYVVIHIREWDYNIEIMVPIDFMRVHSTHLEQKPRYLHDCVLGFDFSLGQSLVVVMLVIISSKTKLVASGTSF